MESLILRGEHVIVEMRVVYRGKKSVHYKGCFITVKLFEKAKIEKRRERERDSCKKKKNSELAAALTLVPLLELRFNAASLHVLYDNLNHTPAE